MKYKKIHCIGIGGIGFSAIPRFYKNDASESPLIEKLREEGMIVTLGENAESVPNDIDLLIYTIAIQSDNKELLKAHKMGVKILSYPEALGELTLSKKTIAIAGTHGKTTTTAMVYKALKACGINPTVIVGSLVNDDQGGFTNFIKGDSEYLVIESCEYKRSFLNYNPSIVLITNIDADHLDYYKDIGDITSAFQEFADKLPENGFLIAHQEGLNKINFKNKILADIYKEEEINLSVPGAHNRKNAQLVLALGFILKLDEDKVREGLLSFTGTWRRQEYKGEFLGSVFYDDYAHHPTEVKATLAAFRERFPDKKIIAIFLPHLYSRTKMLFDDFASSFSDSDEICILPIYAAREKFDPTIDSTMLVEAIKNEGKICEYVSDFKRLETLIKEKADKDTVFVTLGAGDIYKIYDYLK